ncbi:Uncharacterized protein SCG7086_CI_00020 [Chlamydiales bacterium SCGC AG-110-P3]|nr:Uncharacterized protein SCG7086_CI_00020 [Chlamydiales bacterium SCGC AG-110-P3]
MPKLNKWNFTSKILLISVFSFSLSGGPLEAKAFIPGTGQRINRIFDDFEDKQWYFHHNFPKSSYNMDRRERLPIGVSQNDLWYEGYKRGHPDVVKRVPTPPNGIAGSTGALLLKTYSSGVPGRASRNSQQDDFILDTTSVGQIRISDAPSVVVHVFLPPWDQWENATDSQFGMRCCVLGKMPGGRVGGRYRRAGRIERYWPGMFIHFNSKDNGEPRDSAELIIRGNQYGHDFNGPKINQTGWWTFGFSFTPDGAVHYYASPGVDALTEQDHIVSHFPYGAKARILETLFINVCNQNDKRTWSTEFIIDDPAIYLNRGKRSRR